MKNWIIIFLTIFLITSVSAGCKDTFYTTEKEYQICFYNESSSCTFSIYGFDGSTVAFSAKTIKNGNFFTYNISNSSISIGNYSVLPYCDGKYNYFTFEVLIPEPIGVCYYISSDLKCLPKDSQYACKKTDYITKDDCIKKYNELNQQPKFLRGAILNAGYLGELVYPSKPLWGLLIFILVLYSLYKLISNSRGIFKRFTIR